MAHPYLPSKIQYKFYGIWTNKYWKNIPGPFYSTTDNLASLLAFGDGPEYITFDEAQEFIWRQPETPVEFERCLCAMNVDEMGSYQIDGDKYWTPELVRSWWRRRDELLSWARINLDAYQGDLSSQNNSAMATGRDMAGYLRFMENEAEGYLRRYIFLLEKGRLPGPEDKLPLLEGSLGTAFKNGD